MTNEVTPFHDPGDTVTCRADGAVTGKRFVTITGPREDDLYVVGRSGAGARVFGVASRDTADGGNVMVFRPGGVLPVTVGAAGLDAGDPVKSDAQGRAVVAGPGDNIAGFVLDDVDAAGDAMVSFYPGVLGTDADDDGAPGGPAVADIATANGSDAATTQALANATKAKVNELLAALRTAGVIEP